MSTLPVFVGLDYHQSSIQVCVMDASGHVLINKVCENRWQAIVQLVHRAGIPVRVAIEACTGSMDLAQQLVDKAGWSVDLAHTTYVARMKRQPDKTDYSDARMLADLTRVGYLPRVWLPPAYIRDLRRLVSLRNSLVIHRKNLKLRLSGLLRDCRINAPHARWSKAWLAWIQQEGSLPQVPAIIACELLASLDDVASRIEKLEASLAQFTAHDPIGFYLDSLPAIGPVTAWILRAAIGDVTRFKNGKQLAHYCGVSPANASSGKRIADSGLIDSGNKLLRSTLMELAHRLGRTHPRWKAFKLSMLARGKPRSVITAAIANRFIRGSYHPWKQFQIGQQTSPATAAALDPIPGEVSSSMVTCSTPG
jgi:transposase